MKKIIAIILTTCLAVSLLACSSEQGSSDTVKIGGMTYSKEAVEYATDMVNIANKYIDGSMEASEASERINTINNSIKNTTGKDDNTIQTFANSLAYAFTTLVQDEANGKITGGNYTNGDYDELKKAVDNLDKAISE